MDATVQFLARRRPIAWLSATNKAIEFICLSLHRQNPENAFAKRRFKWRFCFGVERHAYRMTGRSGECASFLGRVAGCANTPQSNPESRWFVVSWTPIARGELA